MNRRIVFSEGEYYHLYNRGVEKRDIFLDESDHKRFLSLLYLCNSVEPVNVRILKDERCTEEEFFERERNETLLAIGAYCLMPNHFHLLVKEIREGGITVFMRKLSTAYTMYFNKKNHRVGPLFQGTFKAEHADSDEYLKYLYSYIHLNPVKLVNGDQWNDRQIKSLSRAGAFLEQYKSSSYRDYAHPDVSRPERAILNSAEFPEYFVDQLDFVAIHQEWLNFHKGSTFAGQDVRN